jgi:hypothetical protein
MIDYHEDNWQWADSPPRVCFAVNVSYYGEPHEISIMETIFYM